MSLVARERARVLDAYGRRAGIDDRYSLLRADQVMISAARARGWGSYVLRHGHALGRVVEIGCGRGGPTRWALEAGARSAAGADVQLDRVRAAHATNPALQYLVADGQELAFGTRRADTILCSTLFSSVLDDAIARRIATEIDRVLAPSGVVLWFDFFRDNPANPDVRGVTAGDVHGLFPGYVADLERVVLAPPIARRLLWHPRLAASLELLPFLRTHLVGGLRKR